MDKLKKIVFEEREGQHARLKIRLAYDNLKQGSFFREIIRLYIDKDPKMNAVIDLIKGSTKAMGRKKILRSKREIEEGENSLADFGLSEKEKKEIYDLIESEENLL